MDKYQLANAALSAGMGLSANGAPILMNSSADPSRAASVGGRPRVRQPDVRRPEPQRNGWSLFGWLFGRPPNASAPAAE